MTKEMIGLMAGLRSAMHQHDYHPSLNLARRLVAVLEVACAEIDKGLVRECPGCGATFLITRACALRNNYCSQKCEVAARLRRVHEATMALRIGRTCSHCSQPIPVELNNQAKYCSKLCQSRARYKREREARGSD